MALVSLIVCGVIVLVWLLWQRVPVYKLASQLPGEKLALPLLGHTYLFFGCHQQGIFARIRSAMSAEFHGLPYCRFWVGPQLVIIVTAAHCVEKVIFNRHLHHKGHLLHAADKIVGNGMLFGSGEEVKQRRRVIAPGFNLRMLEQYLNIFHKHTNLLVKILQEKTKECSEINIEKLLHCCSFDAVNETSIDVKTNCLLGSNSELIRSLIEVYGLLYEEMTKPWIFHGRNLIRTTGFKFRSDEICDMLDLHIIKALERKKEKIKQEKERMQLDANLEVQQHKGTNADAENNNESGDIVSTLEYILKADSNISDDDVVMEIKNIFLASSDTVAQISSFLLKMFAIHPEYQEQAYKEVRSVVGDRQTGWTMSELSGLQFLDCCLKETLRLFPIAPLLVRMTTDNLHLDDVTVLPPGTTLVVGAFWTHRSPQYWRHPNCFYPQHFSEEQARTRPRGAFIPFSGGPHSCIGQHYAMLFMKIVTATILREFQLEPADKDYEVSSQRRHAAAPNETGRHPNSDPDSCQPTVGYVGKIIRPDYVAEMDLCSDISVRLVGGISVKLRRRNNNSC